MPKPIHAPVRSEALMVLTSVAERNAARRNEVSFDGVCAENRGEENG